MPAPRMRDISISRAKPAMRLTSVSPPMVPVALWRFMRCSAGEASRFRRCVGRRWFARTVAFAALLLRRFELRDIGAREIDRIEQERWETGIGDRVCDDLTGEREDEARRFDQQEWGKRLLGHIADPEQPAVA